MIENIEMNPQFEKALDLMENSEKNVFVTGRAGTGKSTLLEYFRCQTEKQIVVLAPTGVAAVNIAGQTIHSFFGFKPDITVQKVRKNARKKDDPIYQKLDAIVIDEISMVRADLLDCIDEFLRINGKAPGLPFGGIQMIFVGDLYQIPPVVVGQERKIFREFYESEYFFASRAFKEMEIEYLELEKIYRQSDKTFIELLNKIRNKNIIEEDIRALNCRVLESEEQLPEDVIYLTTTNAMAVDRNERELKKLPGALHHFEALVKGEVDKKHYPADEVLQLKEGARVMLLNNDAEGRWINGTVGTVDRIKDDCLEVTLENGNLEEVRPNKWEITRFYWNEEEESVDSEAVGTFKQFPVKLAWAITIHKSQGKTFDRVVIDLGKGVFASGQFYVALSRCRSLEGVFLKRAVREKDIWADWRVMRFITNHQYQRSEKQMPLEQKIRLIEEAIENDACLQITYLKNRDEKTRREIKPERVGEMHYRGRRFTGLEAYCFNRKEFRNFRVDRILEMHYSC